MQHLSTCPRPIHIASQHTNELDRCIGCRGGIHRSTRTPGLVIQRLSGVVGTGELDIIKVLPGRCWGLQAHDHLEHTDGVGQIDRAALVKVGCYGLN